MEQAEELQAKKSKMWRDGALTKEADAEINDYIKKNYEQASEILKKAKPGQRATMLKRYNRDGKTVFDNDGSLNKDFSLFLEQRLNGAKVVYRDENGEKHSVDAPDKRYYSEGLVGDEARIMNELAKNGTKIYSGELDDVEQTNFNKVKAVHAALTDKGLINTELVLSETMIENNGYLDGRTVVIGKDKLTDGGYVDTVIHEVAHFTEGSAEYKAYAEHIIEQVSDERITEIAELNGIEAKTKDELIELVRSSDKPGENTLISELVASESARLFDSDASVRRLARSNEGLARKILNRIRDFIDVLLAKTPDERAAIKQLMKQERLFEAALRMQGREYAEKHFAEMKREAEAEANSQTSENLDAEGVDSEGEIQYNKKKKNRLKFKFQHNNFPPENERQSEAHRLAVWWARRSDIEAGDQTLVSMNDTWYLVEKFDDALNYYQVEDKISQSEFDAIFKEIKKSGKVGQIKSILAAPDGYGSVDRQYNSVEKRESGLDSVETRYGRESSEVVRLDSKQVERRERSSSDGSRDSQSRGTNREGVKYSLKKKQVEALESRGVKGDALLDAIDLADEILAVNGEITDDSKAVLYHATSAENAKKIIATGKMYGKEDALFFSTKNDGEISGYGDTVIEAKIPLEKLTLNDVFSDEVHVTMSVKPYVMTNIRYSRKKAPDTERTDGQKENAPEGAVQYERKGTPSEDVIDLSKDNELASRIKGLTGSAKYKEIRNYIFEVLGKEPVRLSDGKIAIIDNSDALHIANKSGDKKTAYISYIKNVIEKAELYAEDTNVGHDKFNYFCYYRAFVKYDNETMPVFLNVGRGINDKQYHIYDITRKIKDTANRINGFERPKPNEGYAQKNDVFDISIPDSEQKSNTFSENSSKNSGSEAKNDSGAQYSRKKAPDTKRTDGQNLGYNKIKKTSTGDLSNEQNAKDSGLLVHGREASAVSGSKNDQRKQSYDSSTSSTQVAYDGIDSERYAGKSGHNGKVTTWLSSRRFISQASIDRFRETLLRDRSGLNSTDINGKTVPTEILQTFNDTIFTDEKGSLLALYHWTPNKFKVFARGDVGFHFGTYESSYGRREGKTASEKGADIIKEVYLNITKPILLDDDGGDWDASQIAFQLWEQGLITLEHQAKINRMKGANYGEYNDPASVYVRKLLEDLGYDGIIYENAVEDKGSLSVIALYPEQIHVITDEKASDTIYSELKNENTANSAENEASRKVQYSRKKAPAAGEVLRDIANVETLKVYERADAERIINSVVGEVLNFESGEFAVQRINGIFAKGEDTHALRLQASLTRLCGVCEPNPLCGSGFKSSYLTQKGKTSSYRKVT